MRDSHDGMPEILDAFASEGHYFAVVKVASRRYKFGVSRRGYLALRRAKQLRPLDMMPGLKYRHFFAGGCGTVEAGYWIEVRTELNKDATKTRLAAPKDLYANLLWFELLKDPADAAYLEIPFDANPSLYQAIPPQKAALPKASRLNRLRTRVARWFTDR